MEMKEHGCYLANWACLKGRDNQNNLATWQEMFLEKSIPYLEFCRKNQVWMDVIQCCMMISWTYLALSSLILFASNLEWLVTKIPKGIFSQIYFYAHFTKASEQKSESSGYLSKVLVLGQELVLGKPSNCVLNWWSGFPFNTNIRVPVSRFIPKHNEICNIYDKDMHLHPPF